MAKTKRKTKKKRGPYKTRRKEAWLLERQNLWRTITKLQDRLQDLESPTYASENVSVWDRDENI